VFHACKSKKIQSLKNKNLNLHNLYDKIKKVWKNKKSYKNIIRKNNNLMEDIIMNRFITILGYSILTAIGSYIPMYAMEQDYTQNYQQPTLQYKHHSYLSDGQHLGWLYIPQVNDWALINLGFNTYPSFNPQTGHANFFYANPDVPTAKNPHGLYFWASQYAQPIIGNNNLRTAVKPAPGNQHADVIYNDQNQQYGFMWYGTYYHWDASIHVEHGYFTQSSPRHNQRINTQPVMMRPQQSVIVSSQPTTTENVIPEQPTRYTRSVYTPRPQAPSTQTTPQRQHKPCIISGCHNSARDGLQFDCNHAVCLACVAEKDIVECPRCMQNNIIPTIRPAIPTAQPSADTHVDLLDNENLEMQLLIEQQIAQSNAAKTSAPAEQKPIVQPSTEQKKQEHKEEECSICAETTTEIYDTPCCKQQIICTDCASKIDQCPFCRKDNFKKNLSKTPHKQAREKTIEEKVQELKALARTQNSTALKMAIASGELDLVQYLVEKRNDELDIKIILELAINSGKQEIVSYFTETHGVSIKEKHVKQAEKLFKEQPYSSYNTNHKNAILAKAAIWIYLCEQTGIRCPIFAERDNPQAILNWHVDQHFAQNHNSQEHQRAQYFALQTNQL
jgi:hypothetical protein